jgi:LPXTG-site transpeptidase (sortase) family protein
VTAGLLAANALSAGQTVAPPGAATAPPPTPPRIAAATGTPHVQPRQLKIPSIDVRSRFVPLGVDGRGTLQAPTDYRAVGWYAEGPAPGDAGGPPAVLAGHVDSAKGPAVFYRLRDLKKGDDVQIQGIDGKIRHFTVYRMANYTKSGFPAAQVYAPSDKAEIRLITCTGQFDQAQGGYRDNLVAYAALTRGGD